VIGFVICRGQDEKEEAQMDRCDVTCVCCCWVAVTSKGRPFGCWARELRRRREIESPQKMRSNSGGER
jgi:hypothetical protein